MYWLYKIIVFKIFIFPGCFLGLPLLAQEVGIEGRIVDENTQEALPFVTVFINNTTRGTVADENGEFKLTVTEGFQEIVLSLVGYESLVYKTEVGPNNPRYVFQMAQKLVDLKELEVKAVRTQEWYDNLKVFEYHFLGNSKSAMQCKILNPETLIIDRNKDTGVLKVYSNESLEIENHDLGYNLKYLLSSFEFDLEEKNVHYLGYPNYSEMEGSRLRERRWARNRVEAYKGSWMHFKKALKKGNIVEEGFEVRRMEIIPNPDRPDERIIEEAKIRMKEIENLSFSNFRDSLLSIIKRGEMPKTIYKTDTVVLDENEFSSGKEGMIVLDFEGFLQITYTKGKVSREYVNSFLRGYVSPSSKPVSNVRITGPVTIYPSGLESDPLAIYMEGYWAWQKMGDTLPTDYKLEE